MQNSAISGAKNLNKIVKYFDIYDFQMNTRQDVCVSPHMSKRGHSSK